jgi:hypothetical protein
MPIPKNRQIPLLKKRFLAKTRTCSQWCVYSAKPRNSVGAIDKGRRRCAVIMSVEANVQKMIDDLTAALADAVKHDKGNSAAGTRVRKAMQAIKADSQGIRVQVQNDKNN